MLAIGAPRQTRACLPAAWHLLPPAASGGPISNSRSP